MKKILLSLLIICCLSLIGCNSSNNDSNLNDTQVLVGTNVVSLNDDMSVVLEKLGEPSNYSESKSCLFEGMDKTYNYSHLTIITYPDGDKDYVYSISLDSKDILYGGPLQVGDDASKISESYSNVEETPVASIIDQGKYSITYYLNADKIEGIEIILNNN